MPQMDPVPDNLYSHFVQERGESLSTLEGKTSMFNVHAAPAAYKSLTWKTRQFKQQRSRLPEGCQQGMFCVVPAQDLEFSPSPSDYRSERGWSVNTSLSLQSYC